MTLSPIRSGAPITDRVMARIVVAASPSIPETSTVE